MAVDGALAALASVALGEHIAIATAGGLVLVIAGMLVVLYATASQERAGVAGHSLAAVLLAAGAACGFALFLLAAIRAGDAVGDAWLQLIYRVLPFVVVGVPLLWRRAARAARQGLDLRRGRRRPADRRASCSTAWRAARAASRSRRCSPRSSP